MSSLSEQLSIIAAPSGRHWLAEDSIVSSLFYDTISSRHEPIPEAHARIFQWLLGGKSKDKSKRPVLLDWLRRGSGLYWISGKPGSGKSTLMKFVAGHARTRAALGRWARSRECVTAAYYFWNAGT